MTSIQRAKIAHGNLFLGPGPAASHLLYSCWSSLSVCRTPTQPCCLWETAVDRSLVGPSEAAVTVLSFTFFICSLRTRENEVRGLERGMGQADSSGTHTCPSEVYAEPLLPSSCPVGTGEQPGLYKRDTDGQAELELGFAGSSHLGLLPVAWQSQHRVQGWSPRLTCVKKATAGSSTLQIQGHAVW